ncbi:MAG: hypothetical protein NTZ64_03300 [Polaromonas sp.]|nr:hypothetical protein [Polaromonas sp.]
MNSRFAVPAADTKHWGSAVTMRFAQFVFGRMMARTTRMPTKFLVGQMVQSVLLKGAEIFANSEHLNAKIYLMYESLVTMSSKLPNNPLQPTVKKLRFLPSAEFSRWAARRKS